MASPNKENERKILNIKIILNTNIPGKSSFPLTKSTLYLKDLEGNETQSQESEYPFFTTDVELPYSDIESMGRIKTKMIKRVTLSLVKDHRSEFKKDFDSNKQIVTQIADIPSKKLRNVIAGYVTRLMQEPKE